MKKEEVESNPILKMTFEFSLMVSGFCEVLDEMRKYTISKQLLRQVLQLVQMQWKHRTLKVKQILYIKLRLQKRRMKLPKLANWLIG